MLVNHFSCLCYTIFHKEVLRMAKTDTQIGFRVTTEFKEKLEVQAQRERRSVSNLIIKVLEEYLAEHERAE